LAPENLKIGVSGQPLISDLTKVEFVSAIARWTRTGEIDDSQAALIENIFNRDVNSGLFEARRVMVEHFMQAEKWLSARKTALRTLDALHIACSWGYDAKLITCDVIMHRSANILGIDNIFFSGVGPG
jgi:predicted nucleic acid-binding protein